MTKFSAVVHHMNKDPETNRYRVTHITPLTRLSANGEVVMLQSGAFFDAGGVEIKSVDVPVWALKEMAKMTPKALKEVGFEEPVKPQASNPEFLDPEGTAARQEARTAAKRAK